MKWSTNEQDIEDYEQEKQIEEWLGKRNSSKFEYQYINSKGNARNTLIKASFSLDQEIGKDGGGTFADIIIGSDGRDLECRREFDDSRRDLEEEISWYLLALGFKREELSCLKKILKLSIRQKEVL